MTLQGSASKSRDSDSTLGTFATDQASLTANVTAPIYDGGLAASQTRQAKELTTQSRLVLDQVRNRLLVLRGNVEQKHVGRARGRTGVNLAKEGALHQEHCQGKHDTDTERDHRCRNLVAWPVEVRNPMA